MKSASAKGFCSFALAMRQLAPCRRVHARTPEAGAARRVPALAGAPGRPQQPPRRERAPRSPKHDGPCSAAAGRHVAPAPRGAAPPLCAQLDPSDWAPAPSRPTNYNPRQTSRRGGAGRGEAASPRYVSCREAPLLPQRHGCGSRGAVGVADVTA